MPESSTNKLGDLLHRRSLIGGVVDLLISRIEAGEWTLRLPSERKLSDQLEISRGTLRLALRKMEQEKLIVTEPGTGTKILTGKKDQSLLRRTGSIGMLLPDHISHLPYNTFSIINGLRDHLTHEGCHLNLHENCHLTKHRGIKILSNLTGNHSHDCWLLSYANAAVQQWFLEKGLPCIVIGAKHANITLPSISPDQFRIGRHAAGILLGLNHRHIAYLRSSRALNLAGATLSEEGITSAFITSLATDYQITLLEYDDHLEVFRRKLLQLFRQPQRPTGLLVGSSDHAIAALTILLQAGYRVPQDISIICLVDSPTIKHYTSPALAHYSISSFDQPLRIMRMIHQLLSEGSVRKKDNLLFPKYCPGESVSPYHSA